MRKLLVLSFGLAFLAALAAPASAYLIDGSVDLGEYAVVLNDTPGEVVTDWFNSGLDIDAMAFGSDANWYYAGLTVASGSLTLDGGPLSSAHRTEYSMLFFTDVTMGTLAHEIKVVTKATGLYRVYLDGDSLVAGTDYFASLAGGDLEVQIMKSLLTSMPTTPYVAVLLDNQGIQGDDTSGGLVPEPATLALMGLGALGLFLRRRRAV